VKTDLQIEQWPVDRLVPYARNSRTHSERQIQQVVDSIREFGFVNPILVDKDGVVIAGHARLAAAKKLRMAEVPVIVLGYLTDKQRRALVIADNKIATNAGWDEDVLRVELDSLLEDGFTPDLIGFSNEELDALMIPEELTIEGQAPEDDAPAAGEDAAAIARSTTCTSGWRSRISHINSPTVPAALLRR